MSDEQATGTAPVVSEGQASPTPPERTAPEPKANRGQETSDQINRALRAGLARSDESSPTPEATASPPPEAGTEPEWQPPKTKAELDRLIQSEADRREHNRKVAAEAKAKKDQERWELDNDPQAVIDRKRAEIQTEERQTAAQEASAVFVQKIQDDYDRAVLDPLVLDLPETVRAKILKDNPFQGDILEQRKAITKDSLAALKKHYKAEGAAEAEAKLRRNPTLIKQSLVDLRDEAEEPMTINGSTSRPPPDVNSWLRGA